MEAPLPNDQFPPDLIAQSRHLITNSHTYLHLPADERRELLVTAWDVLISDRRRRLGRRPVLHCGTSTPGDAA